MDYRLLLKKYVNFVTKQNGGVAVLPMSYDKPFDLQEVHELSAIDEEILDDEGRPPLRAK